MTGQIITCPSCGQKLRVPLNPPPNAKWKCPKCGSALLPRPIPAMPASPAAGPAAPAAGGPAPAVSPAAPAPSPAPTGAGETRLEFSRSVALKSLSIGVGIAAVGVAIAVLGDSTGAMVGGGVVVLLGLGALIGTMSGGLGGVGSCPRCSAEIIATSKNESYKLCPGCREYLTINDGLVSQMDPSSIASAPVFAAPTPWVDLKAVTYTPAGSFVTGGEVRLLHAKWPNVCCVCGEPASRVEAGSYDVYKWNGELVRVNQRRITLQFEGVPYCDVHSKGFTLEKISFPSKGNDISDVKEDLALLFRSYAYRNKFLELNPWPWN